MSKRVAIYGGSFNPPHLGHVLAVAYSLAAHPIDEVLVVPCFQHPFSKELASFEDRFALCELAFGWLPGASVSRVEAELGGESRTLRTLEHLRAAHPDWSLRLLVGADILNDAPKWHAFERVIELAPLLVLGRRGVEARGAPAPLLPEVSSTELRAWLRQGDLDRARELLPARVLEYIRRRTLYGAPA
ncbi:MAG: nicotinate (nicotinamide) nucleotide adenylyltransferase [Polyangiaceae bacterium]|jgi:nicotinate-nucleotide adenylyltransferase|nr:nicotinate (nicotinamide) nucleotide adenylyltransferase [Polyangiaceae bacterium]